MSVVGDLLDNVRRVLLIEHRITELATRLTQVEEESRNTRDRLIRIEGMIEGAEAAYRWRRLR